MAHPLLETARAGPMRPVSLHLPFGARRHGPRAAPLEAFSRTEKIISFCRLLLTIYTLAVVTIDPQQPSFKPNFADVVLGAYVAYSALLFFLVRGAYVSAQRVGFFSAATDVAWVSVIALFTEGGTSPFFALHVFVILSVSVRWGLAATLFVTVLLALLYPGLVIGGRWFDFHESVFRSIHLFRPIYLLVIGYLIGYLGEHERRAKRKLGFMLGLPAAFRRNQAPGRAFTRLVRRALDYFKAERGTLALRDPESGRYFVWDVARRGGRTRLSLRITEDDPFPFRFAGPTEGFMANDVRPAGGTVTCYDVLTGVMVRKAIPAGTPLPGGGAAQALLVAPVLIQREPRGHAAVVRETRRKFTRDDLEFLLLLVAQAASGFENVRLQDKAEEVAVLEERGRIARDLHDGFIQSLAGIDLRVEACKLLLRRDPSRIHHELEELHEAVNRGYREVRHYLSMLRRPAAQRMTCGPRSTGWRRSSPSASGCASTWSVPSASPTCRRRRRTSSPRSSVRRSETPSGTVARPRPSSRSPPAPRTSTSSCATTAAASRTGAASPTPTASSPRAPPPGPSASAARRWAGPCACARRPAAAPSSP